MNRRKPTLTRNSTVLTEYNTQRELENEKNRGTMQNFEMGPPTFGFRSDD